MASSKTKTFHQTISPHNISSPSMSNFSSPNRVIFHRQPTSPDRSVKPSSPKKRMCMCSPTTHAGSFRCSLHKKQQSIINNNNNNNVNNNNVNSNKSCNNATSSYQYQCHWYRLYVRRYAVTNSVVRIGKVEGDLVKRALAALVRPSSHQQRRRGEFKPRPSRLSVMSKAED